jgi:hypothetical protein
VTTTKDEREELRDLGNLGTDFRTGDGVLGKARDGSYGFLLRIGGEAIE